MLNTNGAVTPLPLSKGFSYHVFEEKLKHQEYIKNEQKNSPCDVSDVLTYLWASTSSLNILDFSAIFSTN